MGIVGVRGDVGFFGMDWLICGWNYLGGGSGGLGGSGDGGWKIDMWFDQVDSLGVDGVMMWYYYDIVWFVVNFFVVGWISGWLELLMCV